MLWSQGAARAGDEYGEGPHSPAPFPVPRPVPLLRLPLPLRAILGRPVRRMAALVTRRAEFWVPTDEAKGHDWRRDELPGDLPGAFTASAMRTVLRRGVRLHWQMVSTGEQAQAICLRGGHLSRALLQWCLDQAVNPQTIVEALGANPAVTPAHMSAVRDLLEAHLWSMMIREHGVTALWSKQITTAVRSDSHQAVLAWLAAHHPSERHRHWSPFMTRAVGDQVGSSIARPFVLALPDVPGALLTAVKNQAWPRDARTILALLRHTPCPVSADDLDTLYRIHARTLSPDFLAACFATAPAALQDACWRSALAAQPLVTVEIMARTPGRVWPGLMTADLAPLLEGPSATARLAAIQLLAALPEPPQSHGPARPGLPHPAPLETPPADGTGMAQSGGVARRSLHGARGPDRA